jgi:rubrerythrin
MVKNSAALQALEQALSLERDGHRFYIQAAERTVDPKGAEMFRSLADDERLHERMIQNQIDSLSAGKGWTLPQGVGRVQADLETPLFPKGKLELEKAIRPDASDLDALLFALKIENDSFNLYVEQAGRVDDPKAKQMYEYLVQAERTHFNLVMLNYESLSSNAGWVD